MSDLKALIKELRSEVKEQKAQVQDLKAQINGLNAQVADQKQQVSAQGAQVQNQGSTLQQVQAQQQVIEKKQAEAPVLAADADNPGYFMIPGTKSEMKIGGYVKLDAVDDISSNMPQNPSKTATDLTAIPLHGTAASHRNGQLYMTGQESRLNVATLTKTDSVGDVKTFIEGDFYNYSGSGNLLRLRHAYITAGSFLAGQTWSTFMDLDTGGAETLDFTGPAGYSFTRQAQLRYTKELPVGALAVAVENPHSGGDIVNANNQMEKLPDFVVRYTADPSWGHVALAGLGHYLVDDSGAAGPHPSKMTYGILAGIGVKTFGKDMLVAQTVDGNGVGRYMNQGLGSSAVLYNGVIRPINIYGGTVGYTHVYSDAWRSNLSLGYSHFSAPAGDTSTPIKGLYSLHANAIWTPIDNTDVGLEYILGRVDETSNQATSTNESHGMASRIMGSVKYTF